MIEKFSPIEQFCNSSATNSSAMTKHNTHISLQTYLMCFMVGISLNVPVYSTVQGHQSLFE